MPPEEWRDISGFEGRYQVSNLGRIKSLTFRGNGEPKIMIPSRNYSGYHVITLGKIRRQFKVHALVLEAFVGPRPSGYHACHNDSNKDNNQVSNLRWDSAKGNIQDRRRYVGEQNPNSKMSNEETAAAIKEIKSGLDKKILAKKYGVTVQRINQLEKVA